MKTLLQDLRYGLRMFLKNPGFTAVAVLTLALGIGANTAIFSVVNAVLLRPLPYEEPDRLIMLWDSFPTVGFPKMGLSEMEFVRLRSERRAFKQFAAYDWEPLTLSGADEPERVSVAGVSADFFSTLGVQAARGRNFMPEEEDAARSNVVLLSHEFWQRKFSSDPSIIGQSLTLSGTSYTIIGALPPGFRSPPEIQTGAQIELWIPLGLDPARLNVGSHNLTAIARLADGATIRQAEAELATIVGRVAKDHPNFYPSEGMFSTFATPLHEEVVGDVRLALLVLLGAVAFVLLIACANVANLLLVRGEARQKEVAIRAALGAGQGRITRQLLAESALLALIGGGFGILLAGWGLDALVALSPGDIPRLQDIGLDGRVLGFTLLVSIITGLLFGITPALRAAKLDLNATLKEGGRSPGAQMGRSRLRRFLVVTEMAMALMLLVGAGLLIKSFWRLQQIDPGFVSDRLLTMSLSPSTSKYDDNQKVEALYERMLDKVRELPGVEGTAVAGNLPISGSNSDTVIQIEGRAFDTTGLNMSTDYRVVSLDYPEVMGMRLMSGRFFENSDREGATRVAIINEALARNHWPNEDPTGKRLRLLDAPPDEATTPYMTIVGMIANAKNRSLSEDVRQELLVPLGQQAGSTGDLRAWLSLIARTESDPMSLAGAIRQQVWSLDPSIPIANVRTMDQMIERAIIQPRFNMILLGLFALVALGLGAIGIYGVISYTVARRTHEIGVRMALGAGRGDVLRLVVGEGITLALIGAAMGLAGAFALTRLMSSLLFGVSATDPLTFALIPLLLLGIAIIACYIPARRAARVDPMEALRYE